MAANGRLQRAINTDSAQRRDKRVGADKSAHIGVFQSMEDTINKKAKVVHGEIAEVILRILSFLRECETLDGRQYHVWKSVFKVFHPDSRAGTIWVQQLANEKLHLNQPNRVSQDTNKVQIILFDQLNHSLGAERPTMSIRTEMLLRFRASVGRTSRGQLISEQQRMSQ
jgi:hypothetical protein